MRGALRDFRLFLGCLVVGITVIAAVGVLSGRIEQGIRSEAKTLLGGDAELSIVNVRLSDKQLAFLKNYGQLSETLSMRAMATFGASSTLVELKGVDTQYPLLGAVTLASPQTLTQATGNAHIVIGEDLSLRLGVKPGDPLIIGDAHFIVSNLLQKEPDRIAGAFSLGPRVIASIGDLEKTGMLLPGNLIRYNYRLLLTHPTQLEAFKTELAKRFPDAPWVLKTFNENNRTVQGLVERLQLFLTLAGLSALLIGGVGILNAAEAYITSKSATIATFKALGAKRNTVFLIYCIVLAAMTFLGIAISIAVGLLLSSQLLPYLGRFFPVSLDASHDWQPLLLAALFGLLTVFTFSIAVLSRGIEVKPTMLFRGLASPAGLKVTWGKLLINILFALMLIALVVSTAEDRIIASGFIGVALACFTLFILVARIMAFIARHLHLPAGKLRLAVANLQRPGAPIFSIMLSVGIGLSVLVALLLVEGNVERDIKESIPAQAPSLFLFDIQPDQKDPLTKYLSAKSYVSQVMNAPMVRGRIARLKGIPVEQAPVSDDVKWATESDRGLSYAAAPPLGTKLTEGKWWAADYRGKPLVSLDRTLARGMKLKLGDTLTLNILGQDIEATIANLREVNYLSLRINFALIFSPGAIEQFPSSGITTLHVDGINNEAVLIHEIAQNFPNVSAVRIRESLVQLQEMVGHISTAVRITAIFSLISGVMVLGSALAATLDKRAYDTVVFKVLGAKRRDILEVFVIEWFIIACVTGALSCLFGAVGAWLILTRLQWIEFHLLWSVMARIMLATLAFIACTGMALQSRAFSLKANAILRNE